jgi:conjugal transfer ATP-binding protein TraC
MWGDTPRVRDLVPLLAYDSDERIFYCEDHSLAFGWVCAGLSGGDQSTEQRLRSLLVDEWPDESILQIALVASSDLLPEFDQMRAVRPAHGHPVLRDLVAARIQFLSDRIDQPFSGQNGMTLRRMDVYIVGKIPARSTPVAADEVVEAGKIRSRVQNSLAAASLRPVPLDQHQVVRRLGSMVNRSPAGSWRHAGPESGMDLDLLLKEQVFDAGTDIRVERSGTWLDDVWVQILTPKRFPRSLQFGMASRYVGDPRSARQGMNCPFIVALNIYFPSAIAAKNRISTKRSYLMTQATGPLAKWLPGVRARFEDIEGMLGSLEEGHRAVRASLSVVLFSAPRGGASATFEQRCAQALRRGEEDRARVTDFWSTEMFHLLPTHFVALPAVMNALPFFADRQAVRDLGSYRSMSTQHVARLAPVFSDWRGTGTPSLSLISRNGGLMSVCLFDSSSNYNAVIAAQSGSGKSFLANELIASYRSQGALVWVIDVGRSYANLSEVLGGEFVDVGERDICFNPFPLIQNYEDEVDVLEAVVAAMGSSSGLLNDLQRAALSKVMRHLFMEKGRAMSVDDIADRLLQSEDERVRDVGTQLYNFTSEGQYGRYFIGANTVSFAQAFTVLELENLRNRKHLQRIVLLMLIYAIQQQMFSGDPSQKKLVFIDEAWDLLTDGEVGRFMEVGYRRFRKYNGAALTITQSIADFYNSQVGRAIVDNSANMFLLGQKAETVDQLKADGRLALDDYAIELLKTVQTNPGVYSEMYVRTDRGEGIGRLVVDDLTQLVYSTRPADRAAIRQYTDRGQTISEAARAVVADRLNAAQLRNAAE